MIMVIMENLNQKLNKKKLLSKNKNYVSSHIFKNTKPWFFRVDFLKI